MPRPSGSACEVASSRAGRGAWQAATHMGQPAQSRLLMSMPGMRRWPAGLSSPPPDPQPLPPSSPLSSSSSSSSSQRLSPAGQGGSSAASAWWPGCEGQLVVKAGCGQSPKSQLCVLFLAACPASQSASCAATRLCRARQPPCCMRQPTSSPSWPAHLQSRHPAAQHSTCPAAGGTAPALKQGGGAGAGRQASCRHGKLLLGHAAGIPHLTSEPLKWSTQTGHAG